MTNLRRRGNRIHPGQRSGLQAQPGTAEACDDNFISVNSVEEARGGWEEGTGNAPLLSLEKKVLEVQKRLLLRVHVHERGRNSSFTRTASSSDLMHVIYIGCGCGCSEVTSQNGSGRAPAGRRTPTHPQFPSAWCSSTRTVSSASLSFSNTSTTHNNVLNLVKVEPFGGDARGNHDVLGAGLESSDGILALFLGCWSAQESTRQLPSALQGRTRVIAILLFDPWMATASTPLSKRYSWMSV